MGRLRGEGSKERATKEYLGDGRSFCQYFGKVGLCLEESKQERSLRLTGVDNVEKLEQDFLGTLRSQKFNVRLSASSFRYDIDGHRYTRTSWVVHLRTMKPIYYGNPSNTFIQGWGVAIKELQKWKYAMYHDQFVCIRSESYLS